MTVDPLTVLAQSRLLVIVRQERVVDDIGDALLRSGVTVAEISLRSPGACEAIRRWTDRFGDLVVGAGTVTTGEKAEQAIAAGAQFLISPGLHRDVDAVARAAAVPYIPGAFTPTEIYTCAELGARMIKVFPAARLGPAYIKDVIAVEPTLQLVPTGGIDAENAPAFLAAGAAAVAVGSAAVGPTSDPQDVAARVGRLTDLIEIPRKELSDNASGRNPAGDPHALRRGPV